MSYTPDRAGALFACAAFGMFLGDFTTGRLLPPALRRRLGIPLLLLLAAPYLLFALRPAPPVAAVCVALASVGFSASLVQQERLMALIPEELSGHALGLHSAGMLTMQGVSAALAGAAAQLTAPAAAMTMMAAGSVAVTLTLAAAGGRGRRGSAEGSGAAEGRVGRVRRPVVRPAKYRMSRSDAPPTNQGNRTNARPGC